MRITSRVRCLTHRSPGTTALQYQHIQVPELPPATSDPDEFRGVIETLRAANEKLRRLAMVDDLTETYNRRYLRHALQLETTRAARRGEPLSCAIIDCDHFKAINDRYGHLPGDEVLAELAQVLMHSVKMTDIVARYGGDEFCLLMPDTTTVQAVRVADRLRRRVEKHLFGPQRDIRLTLSIGLSGTDQSEAGNETALLPRADAALYQAKTTGRNRLVTCARGAAPPPPPAPPALSRRWSPQPIGAPQHPA